MKKAFLLIIILSILSIMFWFSSKNHIESFNQTDTMLLKLKLITEDELENDIGKTYELRNLLRRSAHFILYFTFGVFAMLMINLFISDMMKASVLSLVISSMIAGLDEFSQRFSPGRTSSLSDVRFDIFASICGIFIAYLIIKLLSHLKRVISEHE